MYTSFPRSTVLSELARRQSRRNSTAEDDEHPEKRLQVNNGLHKPDSRNMLTMANRSAGVGERFH